jgi:anti-sigma factor RsiW
MLDAERAFAAAGHFATHPFEAARAAEIRAQNDALTLLFDPILNQPVPERLRRLVRRHAARAARRRHALTAASAIVTLLLAGLGGRTLESHFSLLDAVSAPAPPPATTIPGAIRRI